MKETERLDKLEKEIERLKEVIVNQEETLHKIIHVIEVYEEAAEERKLNERAVKGRLYG